MVLGGWVQNYRGTGLFWGDECRMMGGKPGFG